MSQISPTLLSMKQVCKLTSLSRTMINKYRSAGTFPDAVQLGEKRIAFVESEVQTWIWERIERRRH